jgi:hypothetical protein
MQSRTVCFWPVVPLGFGGGRLGGRLLGGGSDSCRALRALPLIFSILIGRLPGLPARSGLKKQYNYYVLWIRIRRNDSYVFRPLDPGFVIISRILPSSSKISKKNLDIYCFVTSL